MNDKFDMGGSAFPVNTANITNPGACFADEGMTLWDSFTEKAMEACIAGTVAHSGRWPSPEKVAKQAGLYADAMIAERKRRMEGQK